MLERTRRADNLRKLIVTASAGALCAVALGGCVAASPSDHAAPDEEWDDSAEPVTCGAKLLRYPVNGPHNGGYDKNALTYTCHPHPGASPDGSDFLAGDHYGNDIFAAKGTPLVAPVTGTVVTSGTNTVGGLVVKIRDACGWDYYHAHMNVIEPGIKVGMHITAGTKIGTVGNTGNASGTSPHLHFSIFPAGNYNAGVDPFPYLQAVDASACGPTGCKRHCEGDIIVDENCGKGNCAAYGSSCVDDAAGVRCVVFYCIDQPTKAHDICLLDGNRGHCDAKGVHSDLGPCAAGTTCKDGKCVAPGGTGGSGSGGGSSSGGASGATGGATSTGGQSGTAGTAGEGSEGGAGGDPWGQAGSASLPMGGQGGSQAAPVDVRDEVEGGCTCGVPRQTSGSGGVLALAALALGASWRRRRHFVSTR
jgi:MYXO-CTERM domain-containing protein